ncbi:hypothetical protein H0H93_003319 [Arthromyces matolae]|nr:hypothetical protein H0H93_003319 [Arthromyces matolae]
MPRENRKRGKKQKKKPEDFEESGPPIEEPEVFNSVVGEPSWIRPAENTAQDLEINPEAPFGYVDSDVKAYFRTVDVQMRDWQTQEEQDLNQDQDPNEGRAFVIPSLLKFLFPTERRMFFVAALTEMGGKEKQLATDPDCSVILERMIYSMDDFVRRVFMDSLTGSFEVLVRHRFASHVCQTLFSASGDTISRETRGIFPVAPESQDKGELRSLTQLVFDVTEELFPSLSSLIMDPFASHVIRAVLSLLSSNSHPTNYNGQGSVRSKKSAAWKAKQGPMKSMFFDEKGKSKEVVSPSKPAQFKDVARRFVEILRNELGNNEVRALAANKVASPGLQMLLEVETECGMADEPHSLMDTVMVGIISACDNGADVTIEPSDYLNTLLRDPTSSHLLETIVSRCPDKAFVLLWNTYFKGKLARLANHPVANFVLAKAMERSSPEQLSEACEELKDNWNKMIRASRTGVLRAVVDRSVALSSGEVLICELQRKIVPAWCRDYKTSLTKESPAPNVTPFKRRPQTSQTPHSDMKIQGSLLLQSLLRLPAPHNDIVITNFLALSVEDRIGIAHDPSGSRVYDAFLESPTVPSKGKRELVMGFIGHYHSLVDDRLGSRVGDRCYAFADTYLKEKIARSLFVHEQFLAASFYGKFFARNLNLYLLQRRPNEWKSSQTERKRAQEAPENSVPALSGPSPASATETTHLDQTPKSTKRKRHPQVEDEIDAVFNASLGKRIKKAALEHATSTTTPKHPTESETPESLRDVLGAIKSAPAGDKSLTTKRRRH